jgi:hypothetical protein
MPRELLTLFLPLVLPTVLYLAWLRAMRWSQAGGAVSWRALPWVWLGLTGVGFAALVLFVVTVHFGTSAPGIYVAPHVENGRVVPGHIVEPGGRP